MARRPPHRGQRRNAEQVEEIGLLERLQRGRRGGCHGGADDLGRGDVDAIQAVGIEGDRRSAAAGLNTRRPGSPDRGAAAGPLRRPAVDANQLRFVFEYARDEARMVRVDRNIEESSRCRAPPCRVW